MRFLLTNDDGIDAPGLAALRDAVDELGIAEVWAPAEAHSGCGHRVTTHAPLRTESHGPGRHAVHGTPADCVRVALHLGVEFDWILSGINAGGNLGADTYLSGTVAAVREGVLHGKPGIAFSHYRGRGMDFDWPTAARRVRELLPRLLAQEWTPGTFWSVNLPHVPGGSPEPTATWCRLDPNPLPLSFREEDGQLIYDGVYHSRRREPDCDVDVCFRGDIAITRINLFD